MYWGMFGPRKYYESVNLYIVFAKRQVAMLNIGHGKKQQVISRCVTVMLRTKREWIAVAPFTNMV